MDVFWEDDLANCIFYYHGYNQTSSQTFFPSWTAITNEIAAGRPFLLNLEFDPTYGNHTIVGYAWSAFVNSGAPNTIHFIKVADGWTKAGRYIDWDGDDGAVWNILNSITWVRS